MEQKQIEQKAFNFIRWALLLPASILAYVSVNLFFQFCFDGLIVEGAPRLSFIFLSKMVCGFAFVVAGVLIAPNNKRTTVAYLSSIVIVCKILFVNREDPIGYTVGWLAIVIGALSALFCTLKKIPAEKK